MKRVLYRCATSGAQTLPKTDLFPYSRFTHPAEVVKYLGLSVTNSPTNESVLFLSGARSRRGRRRHRRAPDFHRVADADAGVGELADGEHQLRADLHPPHDTGVLHHLVQVSGHRSY